MREKIIWFIHCMDEATNESIAEALQGLQSEHGEYECLDGKKRFLYKAPDYAFTVQATRSKGELVQVFRSKSSRRPQHVNLEIIKRWRPTNKVTRKSSDDAKVTNITLLATCNIINRLK